MLNMLFATLEVMSAHSVAYGLQFDRALRTRLSQAKRDGNERLASRLLQLIRSPIAAEVAWLAPPPLDPKEAPPRAQAPPQTKRARGQGKGKPQATRASQNSSACSSKGERSRDRDFARRDGRSHAQHRYKGPLRPRSRPRPRPRCSESAPKRDKNPVKAERSAKSGR